MSTIQSVQPSSYLHTAGHVALEIYGHTVRSAIKGAFGSVVFGSGSFLFQRYLLKIDTTWGEAFELGKLVGCEVFVRSLFAPLEEKILAQKQRTFEEICKEEMPPVEKPDWRKGALEIALFAITFFPKAYLTFQVARRVGCLGETIEGQRSSLKWTFYFFVAVRLIGFIHEHLPRCVQHFKNSKKNSDGILYFPHKT